MSIRETNELDIASVEFLHKLDLELKVNVQIMFSRSVWLGGHYHRSFGKGKVNIDADPGNQRALDFDKLDATSERNLSIKCGRDSHLRRQNGPHKLVRNYYLVYNKDIQCTYLENPQKADIDRVSLGSNTETDRECHDGITSTHIVMDERCSNLSEAPLINF